MHVGLQVSLNRNRRVNELKVGETSRSLRLKNAPHKHASQAYKGRQEPAASYVPVAVALLTELLSSYRLTRNASHMIGDLIDENELATGLRQDGLFFSARAFFAKASYSVGHLFAGIALDLYVRLPFEAVPGQLDEGILTRMGIVAGPAMAFSAVIAVFVYSRYDLTAARHREIVAQLDKRHSESASQ